MMSLLEEGEGTGKADEVREASKGGCVKMRTRREGEEVKKFVTFADVIKWMAPYSHTSTMKQ